MKPIVRNHYASDRSCYEREYCGQIDFRDSARGPWEVITFMSSDPGFQDRFGASLMKYGLLRDFEADLIPLSSGRRLKMSFKPLKPNDRGARRNLIRHLTKCKLPVIWKECRHGYEINSSGRILRKWPLKTIPVTP